MFYVELADEVFLFTDATNNIRIIWDTVNLFEFLIISKIRCKLEFFQ